jgi:3-methyladenine DNA glycosylase AlkD
MVTSKSSKTKTIGKNSNVPVKSKIDILTAKEFIEKLSKFQSTAEAEKNQRYFRTDTNPKNKMLGVRMKIIFDTAKEFAQLPLREIEKLLDSPYYEVRMGGVSIMDFKARNKKITEEEKKKLFDLYIDRHDRIDNWDLVDRSAPYVVGGYLNDKPREILIKLAKSKNVWERRTSIVSTYYFIRQGDVTDTFRIAELLVKDEHDLIQKAVGSWIRHAGGQNKQQLKNFLDKHAASMPRTMLSYAVEKLSKKEKDFYLEKNKR